MALTAEQIQLRIDTIQAARDSGALSVRHGDTSTQFRSLAEMDKIISELNQQLNGLAGFKRKRLYYPFQSSKGL